MPYLAINDFKFGMDRRRPQAVGVPGTLWTLRNGVISRGGDVVGAKKWVEVQTPLTDTFGLYILRGQPYVFGHSTRPGTLPDDVRYQQLAAVSAADMARILDVKASDGKLYVVAEYVDGSVHHFYDGSRVTSWDNLTVTGNSFEAVALILAQKIEASGVQASVSGNVITVTALEAGIPFTIDTDVTDTDTEDGSLPTAALVEITANVVGVTEILATATVEITGGSSGGVTQITIDPGTPVDLIPEPVEEVPATGALTLQSGGTGSYVDRITIGDVVVLSDRTFWAGSKSATVADVVSEINSGTGSHGFTAVANGSTATITAPDGSGDTYNQANVVIQKNGQNWSSTPFAGGIDASQPVPWTTDEAGTAAVLAGVINEGEDTHGYTAAVDGAIVTIMAPLDTGDDHNGATVVGDPNGTLTLSTTEFAGGVDGVTAVAQVAQVTISGTVFEEIDRWSITANNDEYTASGVAYNVGRSILVHKRRVFATTESLARYCEVNDPTEWEIPGMDPTPASDAGFINISTDADGAQQLVGMGKYQNSVAFFAENSVAVYTINVDATTNALETVLDKTGTFAPRSIVSYGNNDLYYLTRTGVRSIRAQAGTTTPSVADVGSVIDAFLKEKIVATDADTLYRAIAEIEPTDGRYMLVVDDLVFVLSQYTENKITAWSYLEPGFRILDMISDGQRLWARSDETLYVYGGMNGDEFPGEGETPTFLETPFMHANDPAGVKMITGWDAAPQGDWVSRVLVDPNDPTKETAVSAGVVNKITYPLGKIGVPARTSHVALEMECDSAGERIMSAAAIHFEKEIAS
jgi:hypothetical protein